MIKQKVGTVIPLSGVPVPISLENELSNKDLKTIATWSTQQQKMFNKEMKRNIKVFKQQFQSKEETIQESTLKTRRQRQRELQSLRREYKKKIIRSTKRIIRTVNAVRTTPAVQRRMEQQYPFLYKHKVKKKKK